MNEQTQVKEQEEDIKNDVKKTLSTIFVRNMLDYPISFWGSDYFNCYISTNPECMYIVFKKPFTNIQYYNNIFETLRNNKNYISYMTLDNWSIVQMYIPLEYKEDFKTFLSGQYSKFSKDYKEDLLHLYLQYHQQDYTYVKKILFPSKEDISKLEEKLDCKLVVKEILSSPDLDKETFNINNFT